jgi:hypothetical protein
MAGVCREAQQWRFGVAAIGLLGRDAGPHRLSDVEQRVQRGHDGAGPKGSGSRRPSAVILGFPPNHSMGDRGGNARTLSRLTWSGPAVTFRQSLRR